MIVVKINPDKIKDVIGPGGKGHQQDHTRDRLREDRHRGRRNGLHHVARRESGEAARKYVETSPKRFSSAKPTTAS